MKRYFLLTFSKSTNGAHRRRTYDIERLYTTVYRTLQVNKLILIFTKRFIINSTSE